MGCSSSKGTNDLTDSEQSSKIEGQHDHSKRYKSMRDDTGTSELLVAVVGYTGSGMSQFIHDLTGSYQHGVGSEVSLSPTTKEIQKVEATVDGRRIVFIDTPGFDGVARDEVAAFQELSEWLPRNYSTNARLSGVVYMQNMTNKALYRAGYGFRDDDVHKYLKKTCGSDWRKKIVFVSSHWDKEDHPESKESKLKNGYWCEMVRNGSHMRRFGPPGSFRSAKLILSSITPLEGK